MKVDFMIIGAMKAGTTSLAAILKDHPEVAFATRKEPHFFSKNPDWKNHLDEYHAWFPKGKDTARIFGEGSTTYTYYPDMNLEIWRDIYAYNPGMKFIYMVRNPIDRAVSQYIHFYERGYLNCSIEEAIRNVPVIINNGRYYTQLKPFIDRFGIDNVLILDFDDFLADRKSVINDVADFLGIAMESFKEFEEVHANNSLGEFKPHHRFDGIPTKLAPYSRFIPRKIRRGIWELITKNRTHRIAEKPILGSEYQNIILNLTYLDIVALEKITGRDYSHWLSVEEQAATTSPEG